MYLNKVNALSRDPISHTYVIYDCDITASGIDAQRKLVNTMSMLSGGIMPDGTVTSRSPPETAFLHSKFK